jgi:hypothetical protein
LVIIPADAGLGAVLPALRQHPAVVRAEPPQLLVVLRERVAGDVEPERLLLELQAVRLRPLGHVGSPCAIPPAALLLPVALEQVEEALLPAPLLGRSLVGRLVRLSDGRELCGPTAERVERPGLDHRLDRGLRDDAAVHPLAEVEQVLELAAVGAGADDLERRPAADPLDGGEPEDDAVVLHVEVGHPAVDVRREHVDAQLGGRRRCGR